MGSLFAQEEKNTTIKVNKDFELIRLNESFYVHTTWFDFPGFGRYPSNGLIFIKNGKALLIDTPATNDQTKQLDNYLKNSMNTEITEVIVCHYHVDCMGGLKYLQGLGIPSVSCDLTKKKCIEHGLPIPSKTFSNKMTFDFEGEEVVCQYFGGGHTIDNIVVFFSGKKVLFGGCLIKSKKSTGLGSIKDAVVKDWDNTVKKIMDEYDDIDIVVPGHGIHGNRELLTHTIDLVNKHKKQINQKK
ncbi:MAG: subclass B1 metallo-beta-lactamase [Desulfobacterales bacterium]|nr:subclass B1 metallo-beta-lactamase [Desulfobacterales bacterium]